MPTQKSNLSLDIVRSSFTYIGIACLLGVIEWICTDWLQIVYEKVSAGLLFLSGVYLLFYFVFAFFQNKHQDKGGFIFLVLMMLKIVMIAGYLFLFLNPMEIENKREILLFLLNYFALLLVDMVVKMRLLNKEK